MIDPIEEEKLENLVEEAHPKVHVATSLEEEANSNNSLEGYAAMNKPASQKTVEEIEELSREAEAKQSENESQNDR